MYLFATDQKHKTSPTTTNNNNDNNSIIHIIDIVNNNHVIILTGNWITHAGGAHDAGLRPACAPRVTTIRMLNTGTDTNTNAKYYKY